MKRNSGRSTAYVNSSGSEQGFWPSYADMMSAVALILFFLMLMSYIQNLITGNDLQNTQEVLEFTRTQLVLTEADVAEAQKELALITTDLDTVKLELETQKGYMAQQQETIDEQLLTINAQKLTIDDQNKQAIQQQKYLTATQAELKELRSQMQSVAVLRLSILEQIKDSIESVMGNSGKVSIGENGSIILSESILFDTGSSEIKPGSAQMLTQLAKVFAKFLADNKNAKYVDSIVISGHTDNQGGDEMNRGLSTDRANSVLNYLLSANGSQLGKYSKYFCAAGYGATRPVASNGTAEGRAANRRIEISIILKDESVLEIVDQYLAIEMPETVK